MTSLFFITSLIHISSYLLLFFVRPSEVSKYLFVPKLDVKLWLDTGVLRLPRKVLRFKSVCFSSPSTSSHIAVCRFTCHDYTELTTSCCRGSVLPSLVTKSGLDGDLTVHQSFFSKEKRILRKRHFTPQPGLLNIRWESETEELGSCHWRPSLVVISFGGPT